VLQALIKAVGRSKAWAIQRALRDITIRIDPVGRFVIVWKDHERLAYLSFDEIEQFVNEQH
jgi:hypothetical protein